MYEKVLFAKKIIFLTKRPLFGPARVTSQIQRKRSGVGVKEV